MKIIIYITLILLPLSLFAKDEEKQKIKEQERIENFKLVQNAYQGKRVEHNYKVGDKQLGTVLIGTWLAGEISVSLIMTETAEYLYLKRLGGDMIFNSVMSENRFMFKSKGVQRAKLITFHSVKWLSRLVGFAGAVLLIVQPTQAADGTMTYHQAKKYETVEGMDEFMQLDPYLAPIYIAKSKKLESFIDGMAAEIKNAK